MSALLSLLIFLIVAGLVIWGACWAIDKTGAPSPFNWLLKLAIILIVAIFALSKLGVNIPLN